MCSCDHDPPEFYDVNFVKGRKPHRCCECLRQIPVGEQQEVVSGKWESGFSMFRTCMKCVDVRNNLDLECWAHTELEEEVSSGDHDHIEGVKEFRERRRVNFDIWKAEREQQLVIS